MQDTGSEAQQEMCLAADPKIPGSNPDWVDRIDF